MTAKTSCLAGIDDEKIALLSDALHAAGAEVPPVIGRLNVRELGEVAPGILICDIDSLPTDSLEMVRQLRFVLPECLISVYTADVAGAWALSCHLAGANCVLSSESTGRSIAFGLRRVLQSGCFTDPRFADTLAAR